MVDMAMGDNDMFELIQIDMILKILPRLRRWRTGIKKHQFIRQACRNNNEQARPYRGLEWYVG